MEGYNLLHKAAMGGNYKFVKFLINRGMDIKTLTKTNQTIFNLCLQKFPFRIFTGTPVSIDNEVFQIE
jgi:ankyrin repeat protein